MNRDSVIAFTITAIAVIGLVVAAHGTGNINIGTTMGVAMGAVLVLGMHAGLMEMERHTGKVRRKRAARARAVERELEQMRAELRATPLPMREPELGNWNASVRAGWDAAAAECKPLPTIRREDGR